MEELHRLAKRATARANRRSLRRRKTAAYLLLRRLAALLFPGDEKIAIARRLSGKSRMRQLAERVILFFGHRIDARAYYDFALFMPDIFVRAGEFQSPHDVALFNSRLNQNDSTHHTEDKQLFRHFCADHGIPTAAVIAILTPNAADKDTLAADLAPKAEGEGVFFKPQFGFKGAGVGRLSCADDQWTMDFGKGDRTTGNWDQIYEKLLFAGEPLVFQDILQNHPDLARLNPDILHTLRVTTYLDGEDIRILSVVLRIGLGDSTTDNVSVGGLGAPVDMETGRLSCGTQERIDVLPFSLCVAGKDEIDLRTVQLPFFDDALDMARSIHSALPQMFSLGHDIAILPEGPVAVETNHIWGDFQKFHNLGHGAYRNYISNLIDRCRNHPDFN